MAAENIVGDLLERFLKLIPYSVAEPPVREEGYAPTCSLSFAREGGMVVLKNLRSRLLKPHNPRQQVGGLDTGSIGDKATVVTAFISPAAEHLAEKLEPRSEP